MATNTSNNDSKTQNTSNKNDTRDTLHPQANTEDSHSPYDDRTEFHPEDVSSDEEVTPHNVQAPMEDEDKIRQDDVLLADHIEQGFPANEVPRTDEERQKMEEAGIIDKADTK